MPNQHDTVIDPQLEELLARTLGRTRLSQQQRARHRRLLAERAQRLTLSGWTPEMGDARTTSKWWRLTRTSGQVPGAPQASRPVDTLAGVLALTLLLGLIAASAIALHGGWGDGSTFPGDRGTTTTTGAATGMDCREFSSPDPFESTMPPEASIQLAYLMRYQTLVSDLRDDGLVFEHCPNGGIAGLPIPVIRLASDRDVTYVEFAVEGSDDKTPNVSHRAMPETVLVDEAGTIMQPAERGSALPPDARDGQASSRWWHGVTFPGLDPGTRTVTVRITLPGDQPADIAIPVDLAPLRNLPPEQPLHARVTTDYGVTIEAVSLARGVATSTVRLVATPGGLVKIPDVEMWGDLSPYSMVAAEMDGKRIRAFPQPRGLRDGMFPVDIRLLDNVPDEGNLHLTIDVLPTTPTNSTAEFPMIPGPFVFDIDLETGVAKAGVPSPRTPQSTETPVGQPEAIAPPAVAMPVATLRNELDDEQRGQFGGGCWDNQCIDTRGLTVPPEPLIAHPGESVWLDFSALGAPTSGRYAVYRHDDAVNQEHGGIVVPQAEPVLEADLPPSKRVEIPLELEPGRYVIVVNSQHGEQRNLHQGFSLSMELGESAGEKED